MLSSEKHESEGSWWRFGDNKRMFLLLLLLLFVLYTTTTTTASTTATEYVIEDMFEGESYMIHGPPTIPRQFGATLQTIAHQSNKVRLFFFFYLIQNETLHIYV
jgi:hypothetical protein